MNVSRWLNIRQCVAVLEKSKPQLGDEDWLLKGFPNYGSSRVLVTYAPVYGIENNRCNSHREFLIVTRHDTINKQGYYKTSLLLWFLRKSWAGSYPVGSFLRMWDCTFSFSFDVNYRKTVLGSFLTCLLLPYP